MRTTFATAAVAMVGAAALALGCDDDKKPTEPAASASAAAMASASAPAPAPPPPKPTPAEAIAATMKADVAAWNAHDATAVAACYESHGKLVIAGFPDFPDRDAIAAEAKANFAAFPDFKVAVTRRFVHGNTVVTEWVVTGKNDGPEMGQPATGRTMGILGASIATFDDDGLMKEEHRYFDLPTLRSQLDPKAKPGTFRAPAALPTAAPEEHVSKETPDEAKALDAFKGLWAATDAHKSADFAAFLTDDSVMDDASNPAPKKGIKANTEFFGALVKAFPDYKASPIVAFAADGFGVGEIAGGATMTGSFMGLKPTNKHETSRALDVTEWKGGKLVHEMSYTNDADAFVQLGLMPPIFPPPAGSASAAPSAAPAPSEKPR